MTVKKIFFYCFMTNILVMVQPIMAEKNKRKLIFTTLNGLTFPKIGEKIMQEAYRRLGNIKINVVEEPAARALVSANSGRVDGELARIKSLSSKLNNLIRISTLIMEFDIVCFVKSRSINIYNIDSLMSYRVGVQRGYVQVEKISKDIQDRELVTNNDSLFKMLEHGRLDIVITDRVNGEMTLEKFGFKDIRAVGPALGTLPLFHYLHKKNIHYVKKLERVLKQMKREGVIKKITKETIVNLKNEIRDKRMKLI